MYRGNRGGVERIPVGREECDCARSGGLTVLSEDILKVGRLGVVSPCPGGIYVARCCREVERLDPMGVPVRGREGGGGGRELGDDAATCVSCEELGCGGAWV